MTKSSVGAARAASRARTGMSIALEGVLPINRRPGPLMLGARGAGVYYRSSPWGRVSNKLMLPPWLEL